MGAVLTKDQLSAESVKAMMSWFHTYGFFHVLKSTDGGSFRTTFTEEMDRLGVEHDKSSAYNSASNGGSECTVKSIKSFLRKEGIQRVTQELLQRICFKVNNHVQDGITGLFPNSM